MFQVVVDGVYEINPALQIKCQIVFPQSRTLVWLQLWMSCFLVNHPRYHRESLGVTSREVFCRNTRWRNVASRGVCNSARVLSSITALDGEGSWLHFPVSPESCSIWSRGAGWITARKPSWWNSRSSMLMWICSVRWPSFWNPTVWVWRPPLLALQTGCLRTRPPLLILYHSFQ